MSEKRMFAKSIVLSDAFLDMPATARCLYFTLNMYGDDDGFVNAPKSIMRQCGSTDDDLKILIAKKFLIPFESGIIVIKDWRINNYLRSDRYTQTKYLDEKSQLIIEKDGSYSRIEQKELPVKEEPATEQKVQKKSIPLIEREPKNDIEKVEKEYLKNYNKLYEGGQLNSSVPIINWAASRKLTKESIQKYGLETVIKAVNESVRNEFCVQKGYSLTTILSTGVLAGLINARTRSPPKHVDLSGKLDLFDLVSG